MKHSTKRLINGFKERRKHYSGTTTKREYSSSLVNLKRSLGSKQFRSGVKKNYNPSKNEVKYKSK